LNTLSVLLYLAGILPNATALLSTILLVGWLVYLLVVGLYKLWGYDINSWDSKETLQAKAKARDKPFMPTKGWLKLSGAALAILLLLPPERTLYMIMASEVGEVIANTPEAKQILKGLQETLQVQLEKAKE